MKSRLYPILHCTAMVEWLIFYANANGALLLLRIPVHLPNQKPFCFFVKCEDMATGSEDKASKQGRTVISSHEKDHLMCYERGRIELTLLWSLSFLIILFREIPMVIARLSKRVHSLENPYL